MDQHCTNISDGAQNSFLFLLHASPLNVSLCDSCAADELRQPAAHFKSCSSAGELDVRGFQLPGMSNFSVKHYITNNNNIFDLLTGHSGSHLRQSAL